MPSPLTPRPVLRERGNGLPPLSRYSGRGVGGEGKRPSGAEGVPWPGTNSPHPRPLSRSTGRGEQYALTPDPSPGVPGEGSNMPSPPTPLPEYRARGAICPHPRPLSRSTGRGEQHALTPDPSPGVPGEGSNMPSPPTPLPEYRARGATCPHPRPLSRSTGRGEQHALTPDPSPGVPGEGSNMPSPPTPLPEYRERGARQLPPPTPLPEYPEYRERGGRQPSPPTPLPEYRERGENELFGIRLLLEPRAPPCNIITRSSRFHPRTLPTAGISTELLRAQFLARPWPTSSSLARAAPPNTRVWHHRRGGLGAVTRALAKRMATSCHYNCLKPAPNLG